MANERYQQNSHKWQTSPLLTVGLPVTSEGFRASFQVTRLFRNATVSQYDHSFFMLHMYLLCETSPGWLPDWRVFFCVCGRGGVGGWGWRSGGGPYLDLTEEHSVPMHLLLGAVYWYLGRLGYFGVSNVTLVIIQLWLYSVVKYCLNGICYTVLTLSKV